ncbi:UNVERIFIED_CONTAM: hypothetical protein GTU68_061014 [Idotea baltica]|nr:hypothetical protein [Idotea baltica]
MQSIRQFRVFENYIKKSFEIAQQPNDADGQWYLERTVSEAINNCSFPDFGPVHINVPLQEPLYETSIENEVVLPKLITVASTKPILVDEFESNLRSSWERSSRKLILVGLQDYNESLNKQLAQIAKDPSVIVMAESTSNLRGDFFLYNIDRIADQLSDEEKAIFRPEIILTIGGVLVSKKIKTLLRKYTNIEHWRVDPAAKHADTFQHLTSLIPISSDSMIGIVQNWDIHSESSYSAQVRAIDAKRTVIQHQYTAGAPFSDFKVMDYLLKHIPNESFLQLGNSTPVRYSNIFGIDPNKNILVNGNRGVGGIDGTLSTAAGAASTTSKIVTIITGDLAFFYDSNGLWNDNLPANLRVILINNSGGNIFRIIPGPDSCDELEQFFESKHTLNAKGISETFGLDYYFCSEMATVENCIPDFYNPSKQAAAVLEIKTNNELSAKVLKTYFSFIQQ